MYQEKKALKQKKFPFNGINPINFSIAINIPKNYKQILF